MTDVTIGVVGLGEAGALYATGLADAGARVRGYDPFRELGDPRVEQMATPEDLAPDVDVVLSLVGGRAAVAVAHDFLTVMPNGAVFADLNTVAPDVKSQIADEAASHGALMADVAVLAPVPRAGFKTPLLASGAGAETLVDLLAPLGVPITVSGAVAGDAARLKLLRSVFMKGLAALVIESVSAARSAGAEEWITEQMSAELGPDGRQLVDRLITGTYEHIERRTHEVEDALHMLEASDQHADMTRATLAWFERIRTER
ncbi:DUF1932 domain-containing protein [Leifsonia shinshuensis]|uniref:3-hydroxyisobutyrate dehydrogenase-like beta-hydroxyacid dehydrogenase n=1 Tax=Leifsonia shinshuensis TaxID=150026 RepID=A0A853D3N6_9MICO|nr:NAD(P)-dependent oxidoreductase [Leifsonia shinshuensis]NYJ25620.1 3-hydroxyisobutyrate dehydrogenase-like beta-hydroxyacid dehydrogenase [Leifsonia shinshuensis]